MPILKLPTSQPKDCEVSIMFADLAGYTRLSELMGRQQLSELVNRAFSRFVDEIHRYDGVLLEIGGDELFVLFTDEDPSKHVCHPMHGKRRGRHHLCDRPTDRRDF